MQVLVVWDAWQRGEVPDNRPIAGLLTVRNTTTATGAGHRSPRRPASGRGIHHFPGAPPTRPEAGIALPALPEPRAGP